MNHFCHRQRAFTLMEMLVVVGIIAMLIAVSLTSTTGSKGKELTSTGNMVMDQFSLAREYAISANNPVEIWLLRAQGGARIEALQLYRIDENGLPVALGKVQWFPETAGIDSGAKLSPLCVSANAKTWNNPANKPVLNTYGRDYECWYVRFMPDGSTTLTVNQKWYITLHQTAAGDRLDSLPQDYFIISISPVTGRINAYRP